MLPFNLSHGGESDTGKWKWDLDVKLKFLVRSSVKSSQLENQLHMVYIKDWIKECVRALWYDYSPPINVDKATTASDFMIDNWFFSLW